VRSHRVVVDPPGFDHFAGLAQIPKPVLIQAFVSELSTEAFNERILGGFPTLDEM
jgi:hypothetical protein